MCVHTLMCSCAHEGQKRALGPWKLELKTVVRHPTWVLGTEPDSPKNSKCSNRLSHSLLQTHKCICNVGTEQVFGEFPNTCCSSSLKNIS